MRRAHAFALAATAALVGSCKDDNKAIDAAPINMIDASLVPDAPVIPIDGRLDASFDAAVDAKPSSVQLVTCPAKAAAAIEGAASTSSFVPSDTPIAVNDIISYSTTALFHGMVNDTGTDEFNTGALGVGDAPKCLKFTAAGTFHFHCVVHGVMMKGTVTVK